MSAPVEFRHYLRLFTLDDARAGINPLRQTLPDGSSDLYAPPRLQYRYRERVKINGSESVHWSEWLDVPFVHETLPTVTIKSGATDAAPK